MKSPNKILALCLPIFLLLAGGCVTNPVEQAAELRAIYNEAGVQIKALCADPNTDPNKCRELEEKWQQTSPFIDAIEVAAAQAANDPAKWVNVQALIAEYRPKVRALLISIVLRRYLGA